MEDTLGYPCPGFSEEEAQHRFEQLQRKMRPLWSTISSLTNEEQTIVVVPSISLEFDLHGSEMQAYEERFLFLVLLLRQPRARLLYVTSQPINPDVVDYYLGLLPGAIISHARARLELVTPHDCDPIPLSLKLLRRPRLLECIRGSIKDADRAHLVPFNTTRLERDLALRLGIPMYGADPKFASWGTKSGGRKLFADSGVPFPLGFEDLRSLGDVVDAVSEIKRRSPGVLEVMIKHNWGLSGEGNAAVDLRKLGNEPSRAAVEACVRAMTLESHSLNFDGFMAKLHELGGIVEERIVADQVESPSVQMRVTPMGDVELLSTHDQLLGGPSGQSYLGCRFPARSEYAVAMSRAARKIGDRLANAGLLGRFAIDFLAARCGEEWTIYAIEVNLRKGGTTHPFLTLQFLTDGSYDSEENVFLTPGGRKKFLVASDHVESPHYRVFTVDSLFDIAVRHRLHFDQARQRGIVYHMLASVGDRGRFGFTAVNNTPEAAEALYHRTIEILNEEARLAAEPSFLS